MSGIILGRERRRDSAHVSRDWIVSRLLGIDPGEALFSRRGFPATPAQPRLEAAGTAFVDGYNAALLPRSPAPVLDSLASRAPAQRGFFAEGAAMGAAVRTALTPWQDRLSPLLAALEAHYVHLSHVGVGWAMARLPFARRLLSKRLDPRLAPLAMDGRGFHDGYFHGAARAALRRPVAPWGPIYDQGLGRSLWFSCSADPARILAAIAAAPPDCHGDLWAGIGLASTYAGGTEEADVDQLAAASGEHLAWLRQGAAFALGAHARSGFIPEDSARRSARLCGIEPQLLVTLVDTEFAAVTGDRSLQPAPYQSWRRRVAAALAGAGTA